MKNFGLLYDAKTRLNFVLQELNEPAIGDLDVISEEVKTSINLLNAVINNLEEEQQQAELELQELNEILKFGALYSFIRKYIINTEQEGNQENIMIEDLKNSNFIGNKEASIRFVKDLRNATNDIVKNLNNDEDITRFYTNEDIEIVIQIIEKTLN